MFVLSLGTSNKKLIAVLIHLMLVAQRVVEAVIKSVDLYCFIIISASNC